MVKEIKERFQQIRFRPEYHFFDVNSWDFSLWRFVFWFAPFNLLNRFTPPFF